MKLGEGIEDFLDNHLSSTQDGGYHEFLVEWKLSLSLTELESSDLYEQYQVIYSNYLAETWTGGVVNSWWNGGFWDRFSAAEHLL